MGPKNPAKCLPNFPVKKRIHRRVSAGAFSREDTKWQFRKRVVWRMYPRSGFCTVALFSVPLFPMFQFLVPSFRFLYLRSGFGGPGNIRQNHRFGSHPFAAEQNYPAKFSWWMSRINSFAAWGMGRGSEAPGKEFGFCLCVLSQGGGGRFSQERGRGGGGKLSAGKFGGLGG